MSTSALDSYAAPQRPKLLDRLREKLRVKHYSIRTEHAYVDWVKRFVRFHDTCHPAEMGAEEVERFLTHLAVQGQVAASTQNQAKSALLFLYREVLEVELPWLDGVITAKTPRRLPVVLTQEEVAEVLGRMNGTVGLVARLLYGSGMRLLEGVRLRQGCGLHPLRDPDPGRQGCQGQGDDAAAVADRPVDCAVERRPCAARARPRRCLR